MDSKHINTCIDLLLASKNTVCLTGAGISTNAGIPDFRGPQGLYTSRSYDAEKVFDIDYFIKDPKPFYEFALDFMALEANIEPTPAHHALVALEGAGKIKAIITQNIDGLHQKAGSQKVLDMHGNFLTSHCLRCRKAYDYNELKAMVLQHVIPHCSCRGIIKPDIVFFGEDVKYYHQSLEMAQAADLFFVIGTSCVVYPAASLPQFVPGKIVIVNNAKINLNMYNIALEVESDIDVFFNELMDALKAMKIFLSILMGFLLTPLAWADHFQLSSSAFDNNASIPKKYTCDGSDVNPPLDFKNVPPKAKSLVLIVTDPDAVEGTWTHWVVYNIPPNTNEILENTNPGTEGLSDFGKYVWGGPCPPDDKIHHYIFEAYALNTILSINEGPNMSEVETAIHGHVVAESKLTGTYQKLPI